jgi:glycosyltransferase involved in cell wall biosynthesis
MNVSIVIPAYNEEAVIGQTVARIHSLYPDFETIVVDDGSTDNTAHKAREAGAKVFQHPYNIGNGAAVKTGIRNASGDMIVLMDGDGQHDPADIARLLEESHHYDLVVGARSTGSQASLGRRVANWFYNCLASYVAKFPIKDLTSGFRVFHKDIPIRQHKRVGKSKIKLLEDGTRFILIILRIATLFSPLRIFLPVSTFFLLTGLGYYMYTYWTSHRFTNMSALLLSVGVMVFLLGLISEQITQMRYDRVDQ